VIPKKVIFVSGPSGAGKTELVNMMAGEAMRQRPHHVRLVPLLPGARPHLQLVRPISETNLASSRRVEYTASSCFEAIAETIQSLPPAGSPDIVLLEAGGDPCLRYAYPYDRRIFVMPAPSDVFEVFRTPEQAAVALRKVMEDTASFAAEIFGLFDDDQLEEEIGLFQTESRADWSWKRPAQAIEVDETQLRNFLDSPIGVEIASRIQLQPEYHGLVESDVILLNTAVGAANDIMDEVNRRLDMLLGRIRGQVQNDGLLFCCDPFESGDPRRVKLFEKLSLMNHALAS